MSLRVPFVFGCLTVLASCGGGSGSLGDDGSTGSDGQVADLGALPDDAGGADAPSPDTTTDEAETAMPISEPDGAPDLGAARDAGTGDDAPDGYIDASAGNDAPDGYIDAGTGDGAPDGPIDAGGGDVRADVRDALASDSISAETEGGAPTCPSPVPPADPHVAERQACAFAAGAKAVDTLGLPETTRKKIPLKHIVVMMKENRSFDHLLGLIATSGQPAAEGLPATFKNSDTLGNPVVPFREATTCVHNDPGHQWVAMHDQVDNGKMDGFVTSAATTTGTDGHFVMGYYTPADIPFYYWFANTYALSDRHFASVRSGTWPDREYLLYGTSDGVMCTGCGHPALSLPTIMSELDGAGVTWGAYNPGAPFEGSSNLGATSPGVHPLAQFFTDAATGSLPSVVFIDSDSTDEHPTGDVQAGEAWSRQVYESLVTSSLWPSTALIWTYDEAGGFADHVPPSNKACIPDKRPGDAQFFELGVRVPLVVASPWARRHYVSHIVQDHTSITRLIEAVFGLGALTARDANADAMLDMFDFDCGPLLTPPTAPAAGTGGCK